MTDFLIRKFVPDHEKTTDMGVRAAYGKLSSTVSIVSNLVLFALKLLAGILSASVAITADAFNNLSDASSGIITLLGFKMAGKPADPEHPYGHARYEYLSGLLISVLILVIGVELLKSGLDKILHPELTVFRLVTAGILIASIAVKLWLCVFNRKVGILIDSGALKAASADSRNDVLSTAAVLAATVISHFTRVDLDGYMGVAVAAFILYSGVGLVKETVSPLLGRAPDPETVQMIRDKIMNYPGVLGTHDLMLHDYGPGRQFASVHVEVAAEHDVLASHDMVDNIERDFLAHTGIHMVVHMDPIVTADPVVAQLRLFLTDTVTQIHPDLSVHDLRIVPGPTHTNVIFDCVVPADCPNCPTDVCRRIREKVKEVYPDYFCVITVDESFAPVQH